jgi:hypothetical protein
LNKFGQMYCILISGFIVQFALLHFVASAR